MNVGKVSLDSFSMLINRPFSGRMNSGSRTSSPIRFLTTLQRCVVGILLLLATGFLADSALIYSKARLAQYLIKEAWQKTLNGIDQVKPWPWADTWPVARLQSIEHKMDLYILNGAQGNALAFGPGYLQGSAQPGSEGASIIAGHRDTHFQFMQQLKKGDELLLTTTQGRTIRYRVVALDVVDSSKQPLYADQQQRQIILVTCYPFNALEPGGPLRYVARAVAATQG